MGWDPFNAGRLLEMGGDIEERKIDQVNRGEKKYHIYKVKYQLIRIPGSTFGSRLKLYI